MASQEQLKRHLKTQKNFAGTVNSASIRHNRKLWLAGKEKTHAVYMILSDMVNKKLIKVSLFIYIYSIE